MPVQFIGGSSGGGTTDVRTTFADPVLNDALANTTTIVAQYQIPANYLTTNELISIKYISQFGVSNTGIVRFYIYIGSTGTLADTALVLNTSDTIYNLLAASNYGQIYLSAYVYFYAIGTNGLASAKIDAITKTSAVADAVGNKPAFFGFDSKATVDTTQPFYISLVAVTPTTAVVDTLGSYISVGY